MKILILSAWYHPFIHPRAHRWTALAEHWAAEGHEVHVVCSRHRDCSEESVLNGVQVHRAGFDSLKEVVYYYLGTANARGRVGVPAHKPGFGARLAAWIYNRVWKKIYFPDDACIWYWPARRRAGQLLRRQKFDVLITVSLPFTAHLAGLSIGRLAACWLADIGDPFSFQLKPLSHSSLYGRLGRHLEKRVLQTAWAVAVTTEFTEEKYRREFGAEAVAKMDVVPPLLHPWPGPPAAGRTAGTGLKIGYFGALYAPVRTPDALLDLLEKTYVLRPDWRNQLEVHFYGEIFPEFYDRLSAQPAVRLHGLCSRGQVRAAMQEMDVLLNIGNSSDFQLPSKAVEYLASGKPVVNLSGSGQDPFAAFFDGILRVLNLKTENGRVGTEEVRRWVHWLETEKKTPDEAEIRSRIEPYLIENLAAQYLSLLSTSRKHLPEQL